jgi:ubiquinone/menaquinone biosynthesis C-methylase UbiE
MIFGVITGYQRTAAFKGAVDLDLFTAVAEGNDTPAAIASRCRANERGVRILCDTLVVMGFLVKRNGRYTLPPGGELLDRRSPMYAADVARFVASPELVGHFTRVADSVRAGGTVVPNEGSLAPEHPMWIEFARGMRPFAEFLAQLVANLLRADEAPPWKVLDIAAGHGAFGIALAKANPRAEIVALDWPNVLVVAEENAAKAGVADRLRKLPGSALELDYGSDYDLVLVPNLLHHFDPAGCENVLSRAHAALRPGGRVVIVEFVPNDDRVSPPEPASFALVMLVETPRGDAYTFAELAAMAKRAGFAKSECHDLAPSFHRAVIATK